MPTAVSGQSDYFSSPSRQRSSQSQQSQSQTSLQDQLQRAEPYSPDGPAVLLPATTYTHSQSPQSRDRTASFSNNLSRIDTSVTFSSARDRGRDRPQDLSANPPSSANPDDFYRQYPQVPDRTSVASVSLHQDALRTLNPRDHSQSRVGSNGSYSTNWSADDPRDTALPPSIPGLRARKSSVKNLVAQINASSTADVPPVPTQPLPNNYTIQNTSPYLSSAHVSQFGGVRKQSMPGTRSATSSDGRATAGNLHEDSQKYQKRPLFGEVTSSEASTQAAGYGIANPKRRTASESSPMHSPNPMFPPEQRDSQFVLSPTIYNSNSAGDKPEHRRTNSDVLQYSSQTEHLTTPTSARRPPVSSRIPIRNRKTSTASDSEHSNPGSRTVSALDRSQEDSTVHSSLGRVGNYNQSLSVEQPSNASRITSPGRRGKPSGVKQLAVQPGSKSPSLRANIVAPPPKISPPLRSSRPRQPVSSASTAASRARMAEKFNSMQKLNHERRAAQQRRAKPPELTDVDLNARRLRITQALTRSRENDELSAKPQASKRTEGRSRTISPRPDSMFDTPASDAQFQVTIASDSPRPDSDIFESEHDQQYATRSALHAMRNDVVEHTNDVDSPTLGRDTRSFDRPSMQLQTSFLDASHDAEPLSALTDVTVETQGTHIDPEPQEDNNIDAPSLLSHVMQMRDDAPSGEFDHSPQSNDERDDRADVESVNLVLRNTTYLDDDEAISKGYRTNFMISEALPEEPEEKVSNRDSWTSSIHEEADNDDSYGHSSERQSHEVQTKYSGTDNPASFSTYHDQDESYRDTMASDAYTIINIVLQEHSSSGIVDQQFAEDVYQKVLETCPEIEDEGMYDSEKIEQLCLEEIIRRDEGTQIELSYDQEATLDDTSSTPRSEHITHTTQQNLSLPEIAELPATDENLLKLPAARYTSHRHKSSLDSAEDWASTSPSIGDWMRFASENVTPPTELREHDVAPQNANDLRSDIMSTGGPAEIDQDEADALRSSALRAAPRLAPLLDDEAVSPEEYGIAIIRAPSHSPPPPPKDDMPNIEQIVKLPGGAEADVRIPRVPHRVTSLGQARSVRQSTSSSRPPSTKSRAEVTPWEVQDQSGDILTLEARRLKQRKHVIKELVDTEFTYQRDMRVICDIYMQTAAAVLSEDDIRVLFGNVEQVQQFAKDFLLALKQTSKPSYTAERKKEKKEGLNTIHRNSSTSTLASAQTETDAVDTQRDRETRIGEAFETSLSSMESVYTEYIRNRHAANQRLEALERSTAAREWLKECRDNSSDITNAWNLDALLVKPVQRITKYPLLLKELIDATADDHPDLPTLRHILISVTDINMRINDVKKHAEMLDQAINRKRGQSDVRTGFSKAFGRRAEKLKQHVGMADMYEDTEYDKLRIAYDNNYVQLLVVANDCTSYEKGMTQWVNKMVELAAAAEAWVDVGHSHHQQEESKLRHLAMIIRNVHNIALPDHLEHLQKKVIKPMTTTVDILQKFKEDPKGLLHKRDKRLVDYAQMKSKKDRGEKVDKKMSERMDQWEALNTEAKDRMKKLLKATAHLVQSCQGHLVQLQMSWMAMVQQKFSSVMGIDVNRLLVEDIERDWQEEFDYQEASALALGICNGSLMLQAANMTSFFSPSTTLNGEDSPRNMSFSSINKRSISLNSDSSTVPTLDSSSRPGGTHGQAIPESQFDRPYPYPNGRTRAASTTSGPSSQRPDQSSKTSTNQKHISASANFARPGISPIVQQDVFAPPPRLSVETYTPLMSSFQQKSFSERPLSSNTFYSTTAGPSQAQSSHRPRASGVFTSALPMSDSPVLERHSTEAPTPISEPQVLFTAASVYEFNIDRSAREAGFPYLTYVTGEIFDVIGERGELWLAKNQDDPHKQIGWIWNKHFAKLAE